MSLPINDGISRYISRGRISFAMPGHKGNAPACGKNIFRYDVTELDDTDNLFSPAGYIKESQSQLAKMYGTVSSHYLLNGTTSGVYSMVSLAVSAGDKIIVDRFCHKSVINAIILCGAVPVYVIPEYNHRFGISGGIIPSEIDNCVKANPDAKAVIITSPTYYGTVSDVASIADVVHGAGMLLLVDEAHGAHYHISELLPDNAVNCGADMSVQSIHKTLGALSGGALLHINTDRVSQSSIEGTLSMYHTSSPSYGVLCALEAAVFDAVRFDKNYRSIIAEIDRCRAEINADAKAHWVGEEIVGGCGIYGIDKTRIVINFSRLPTTGYSVAELLRRKYKIEVEMADKHNIVCIATPYNSVSDIKALARAVKSITKKMNPTTVDTGDAGYIITTAAMTPRKAHFAPSEVVDMSDAVGRVAHTTVCKYPPGIPLLVPGEEIRAEHIRSITDTLDMGGTVTGTEDDYRMSVLKKF